MFVDQWILSLHSRKRPTQGYICRTKDCPETSQGGLQAIQRGKWCFLKLVILSVCLMYMYVCMYHFYFAVGRCPWVCVGSVRHVPAPPVNGLSSVYRWGCPISQTGMLRKVRNQKVKVRNVILNVRKRKINVRIL